MTSYSSKATLESSFRIGGSLRHPDKLKANSPFSAVAGMNKELQLQVGNRYSVILLVFFAPYVVFELPSNIALRKFGAANWLSLITLLWGITIVCMGLSTNWTHLVVCRTFLGVFEAGFFPGCVYVVSCWYTRYETGKRLSGMFARHSPHLSSTPIG